MVLYTGSWQSNLFRRTEDDDDNENDQSNSVTDITGILRNRQSQSDTLSLYGSMDDDGAQVNTDSSNDNGNDKTITWSDEIENPQNGGGNFKNNTDDSSVAETMTTNTSTGDNSTTDKELPSLTAAFQNAETRPILLNCIWYLVIYFAIAIVAFSFVFEQWSIIDSMYFAVATL